MSKNLISISDLSKKEILDIITFAQNFKLDDGSFLKENLFPDKTIANVFCEPSTRTKSSFEIAAKNLGATVIDFDMASSSIQKGETIFETIDALNLMGVNLCILRHPESVISDLAKYIPEMVFINAGEGSISHPSQTLIDLKTIIDYKDSLDNLNITILGDLDHSRVTSSFVEGLSNFEFKSLKFCGHPDMCTSYLNPPIGEFEPVLELAIKDADVIMALRIQYERFEEDMDIDIEEYKYNYSLTTERICNAKGDVIIMHPGPVNYVEISESLYESDKSVIRQQVANSVAVRMSILSKFLSG